MRTPETELCLLSATELARRIRSGETSSVEVVRAHLARIQEHNPRLNAIVALREAEALHEATKADQAVARGEISGPLHGVPVTIKDVHRVRGMPSTYGLPWYRDLVPSTDCWAAERVRAAGAVVLGRTNVPMGGFDWQCWNPIYGLTVNPWDRTRTPGGSSGGSAAAVAARLVPLDIGSDIAGSIRYPAHCCGVTSLRPTDGLIPNWRLGPEKLSAVFRHFLTSGPIARTVEDLELGLSVLCGAGSQDLRVEEKPRKLRIAWTDRLPGLEHLPLSEDSRDLLQNLVVSLERAGHLIEKRAPPEIDFREAFELWGRIAGFDIIAGLPAPFRPYPMRFLLRFGLVRAIFGSGLLARGFSRGLASTPDSYFKALTARDDLMGSMERFFESVDLWITPASPGEAIPHQKVGRAIHGIPYADYLGGYLCGMGTLGHPIVTLPLGLSRSGMPVGAQLHGPRFGDFRLLRRAREFMALVPELGLPRCVEG